MDKVGYSTLLFMDYGLLEIGLTVERITWIVYQKNLLEAGVVAEIYYQRWKLCYDEDHVLVEDLV
ncbi:hypothetical protein TSUD_152180 [Trifolium subterraneum]|uniref:Uncharacterized protein n=1 Tax=Trifolium subterraneum TaxID=3900 RepID=A0A2Z6MTF7_TRISU|nr:hypothetical protein TSUD_152180 [Trifolium subterraneum]